MGSDRTIRVAAKRAARTTAVVSLQSAWIFSVTASRCASNVACLNGRPLRAQGGGTTRLHSSSTKWSIQGTSSPCISSSLSAPLPLLSACTHAHARTKPYNRSREYGLDGNTFTLLEKKTYLTTCTYFIKQSEKEANLNDITIQSAINMAAPLRAQIAWRASGSCR